MRILITGAKGFLGPHLTEALDDAGYDVQGIDVEEGDLSHPGTAERWIRECSPEVVIHLAAHVGRILGEDDLAHTVACNATATALVAQATAEYGARLLYTSTSEAYGDLGDAECVEGGPVVLPHNLYGLSKRWGEEVAALYAPDGLQVIRLSMPFGPGLPHGRGRAAVINFLWQAKHRHQIPVHRGATRCLCWIADTVDGIRLVLECGERSVVAADLETGIGLYNVGRNDNEMSMLEVAEIACRLTDAPTSLIEEVDPPVAQTVVKRISDTKLRDLGWNPQISVEEGMRRTLPFVR